MLANDPELRVSTPRRPVPGSLNGQANERTRTHILPLGRESAASVAGYGPDGGGLQSTLHFNAN